MCWEELKFSDRFGLTSVIHTVGCDCVAAVLAARTDTRSSMRRGNAREEVRLELNPEPVNLARLIDEVIGTAGQLAEKNKNRLVVEAQENVGALTADPMRPKQILLNLLSNACKFTKEGEVALRERASRCCAAGRHYQFA